MSKEDEWPLPEEIPEWWRNWTSLTDEQMDQMAEDYAREQMETAQSEADFEANKRRYAK